MKKPLILVTTSNNMVEDMYVVRLNHEYVNAVVKAGGIPVIVGSTFGLDEVIELADGLLPECAEIGGAFGAGAYFLRLVCDAPLEGVLSRKTRKGKQVTVGVEP